MEGDLLDKAEKLRKVENYYFEHGQWENHSEQMEKEANKNYTLLGNQMSLLLN